MGVYLRYIEAWRKKLWIKQVTQKLGDCMVFGAHVYLPQFVFQSCITWSPEHLECSPIVPSPFTTTPLPLGVALEAPRTTRMVCCSWYNRTKKHHVWGHSLCWITSQIDWGLFGDHWEIGRSLSHSSSKHILLRTAIILYFYEWKCRHIRPI